MDLRKNDMRYRPPKLSIIGDQSFYSRMVTIFVALLLIALVPTITYNYFENKRIVMEMSNDLVNQVSKTVIQKMGSHFLPAVAAVEISASLADLGAISIRNHSEAELYTMGLLNCYPQFSMLFVADEQGNSIRAWRLPDGSMETRIIKPSFQPKVSVRHWNSKFTMLRSTESDTLDYDPRTRPWYLGAKKSKRIHWTDLYILHDTGKPAITSALPILDDDGNVLSVWAVNVGLESISAFLRELRIGKNGFAFIINHSNEVVAFPDSSLMIKQDDEGFRPLMLQEMEIPSVKAAAVEWRKTGQDRCTFELGGKRFFASLADFPESFPVSWKIAMIVPEDDIIGGVKGLMKENLLICTSILLISIVTAVFVSRGITRPIKLLEKETRSIKNFVLDSEFTIQSHIKEIKLMGNAISAMKSGLQAFRRYVPAELVRQLILTGEEARLGGEEKVLTVFSSDIARFTPIAESTPPHELMVHLSEYFDELTKIIIFHGGTVDKFIGDAILAFWGAPLHDERHAFNCCSAAIDCMRKISELNSKWIGEGKPPFITRIGISTGETIVGNVGSSERINYTAVGDNVNLACRLEGANKLFGTGVLVSRRTYEAVRGAFLFRLLGIITVQGKSEGTTIYELVGRKTGNSGTEAEFCDLFTRGVETYLARKWDEAGAIFRKLMEMAPSDFPAAFYLSRCTSCAENPPGADWRGIEYLDTK